jgi:hypothetical protein
MHKVEDQTVGVVLPHVSRCLTDIEPGKLTSFCVFQSGYASNARHLVLERRIEPF